jgi:hypothetical protein
VGERKVSLVLPTVPLLLHVLWETQEERKRVTILDAWSLAQSEALQEMLRDHHCGSWSPDARGCATASWFMICQGNFSTDMSKFDWTQVWALSDCVGRQRSQPFIEC